MKRDYTKYLLLITFVFQLSSFCSCTSQEETEYYPSGDTDVRLSATPTTLTLSATETTASINVTSNVVWTTSVDNAWCKMNISSGKGNGTISLSVPINTSAEIRKANIVITAQNKEVNVLLEQQCGSIPVISTLNISNITRNSAYAECALSSQLDVTECGVVYALTDNPTLDDQKAISTDKTSIKATIQGLKSAKTYYIRAYAINALGVAYSETKTIKTSGSIPGDNDNPTPSI